MQSEDFIFLSPRQISGKTTWTAPSNIALIKYWGKYETQLPKNPSISFTLSKCITETTLCFQPKDKRTKNIDFEFFFEGKPKPEFSPKLSIFFKRVAIYSSFVQNHKFIIHSKNTFPHSSGIASSASSMAAVACGLMQIERILDPSISDDYFNRKASFLSRLGSGSASRSVEGPVTVWGASEVFKGSSDLFAIPFGEKLHPVFRSYRDSILIVNKGAKKVSSSQGHKLMAAHPFAQNRFQQAYDRAKQMKRILQLGELDEFVTLVELEALTLHAMMMTSNPYFVLMKPNTISILESLWNFREKTKIPVCFTLDAGANVHVLYPDADSQKVERWIKSEASIFCEKSQFITDGVGSGARIF